MHRIGRTGRAGRSGRRDQLRHAARARPAVGDRARDAPAADRRCSCRASTTSTSRGSPASTTRITAALESDRAIDGFRDIVAHYVSDHDVPEVDVAAALAVVAQGDSPLLLDAAETGAARFGAARTTRPSAATASGESPRGRGDRRAPRSGRRRADGHLPDRGRQAPPGRAAPDRRRARQRGRPAAAATSAPSRSAPTSRSSSCPPTCPRRCWNGSARHPHLRQAHRARPRRFRSPPPRRQPSGQAEAAPNLRPSRSGTGGRRRAAPSYPGPMAGPQAPAGATASRAGPGELVGTSRREPTPAPLELGELSRADRVRAAGYRPQRLREFLAGRALVGGLLRELFPDAAGWSVRNGACRRCGARHGPVVVTGVPLVASVSYAAGLVVAAVAASRVGRLGVDVETDDADPARARIWGGCWIRRASRCCGAGHGSRRWSRPMGEAWLWIRPWCGLGHRRRSPATRTATTSRRWPGRRLPDQCGLVRGGSFGSRARSATG